ncbi:MAG: hypothetical protein M5U26_14875 [Planctomycetota bacterium]|nr:hypothetical protein [Planctomycetota bacterium]
MTPATGAPLRQCRDCGRAGGPAGNACAFCGGPLVEAAAPAPRRHPQILAAVITFCLGLLLIRLALGIWSPARLRPVSTAWGDPLIWLEVICIGMTVLFVALRGEEGDFRALFLIALALFIGTEALAFLAQHFALESCADLATLMSFAVAIYASLALTAASYDPEGDPRPPHRAPLLAAAGTMLALTFLRAFSPFLDRQGGAAVGRIRDFLGIAVLCAAIVYLATSLLRRAASRPAPADAEAPAAAKPANPPAPEESTP